MVGKCVRMDGGIRGLVCVNVDPGRLQCIVHWSSKTDIISSSLGLGGLSPSTQAGKEEGDKKREWNRVWTWVRKGRGGEERKMRENGKRGAHLSRMSGANAVHCVLVQQKLLEALTERERERTEKRSSLQQEREREYV